jgi:site-specific recombinase XerD
MDLTEATGLFLAHRRVRCVKATVTTYEQHLRDWLGWRKDRYGPLVEDVTLTEIRAYVTQLTERCMPRTVQNTYRTLRVFWRWLDNEDALTLDQQRIYLPGRIALPKVVERERPAVSRDQVDALLAVCEDDEEGHRNRAMILMLWESGLRVGELARMLHADLDLAERQARVIGKGSKEGYIFWGPRTSTALRRYLLVRSGPTNGPMFRGCASRNQGQALTPDAIRHCLKRLAKRAGIVLPKGAVVHGFRHGCARDMRRKGASKEDIRDILRHEDIETTKHYLGLDIEAPRAAHRRLFDV